MMNEIKILLHASIKLLIVGYKVNILDDKIIMRLFIIKLYNVNQCIHRCKHFS